MAVRTIVLSRHRGNLARPVIIHDIIHGLIYVPSTPCCGFFVVSPDGNCAYVHWGFLRPTQIQSDEPSDLRGSLSPTSVYSTWQCQAVTHPMMKRALLGPVVSASCRNVRRKICPQKKTQKQMSATRFVRKKHKNKCPPQDMSAKKHKKKYPPQDMPAKKFKKQMSATRLVRKKHKNKCPQQDLSAKKTRKQIRQNLTSTDVRFWL